MCFSAYPSEEHTVVFLQKGPLVLVCVSNSRQSEQQLRSELLYVYYQIISMLTQASISRIFEHKKNYDLRRLLAGSEKILDGLLDLMDSDPGFLLTAVHCLPLASSLRDSLSQILQKAITPNLVFSILIAKNQLLTVVQERAVIEDARLEPADIHLLLNLIGASSAFQAGEIWTPICLPLFNPDCYFYTYISYLDPPECTVCLLLLSTDKEAFYAVAECKRRIEEAMAAQGSLGLIAKAQTYSASQVGVADLRHFMYKPFDVPDNHRPLTQFTRFVCSSSFVLLPWCSVALVLIMWPASHRLGCELEPIQAEVLPDTESNMNWFLVSLRIARAYRSIHLVREMRGPPRTGLQSVIALQVR